MQTTPKVLTILFFCVAFLLQIELRAQDQETTPQTGSTPITTSKPAGFPTPPLSGREKFHYYLRGTYGPFAIVRSASAAGINQWRDHPPEWRQGMEGYGRRLSSKFGRDAIDKSIQFGLCLWLREDPRYFPSERDGFWPRVRYAIVRTFVRRKDDGSATLAVSRLAGAFGGGFISRTWQPESNRSAAKGLQSGATSLGADVGFKILQEFWPDIKRRLRR